MELSINQQQGNFQINASKPAYWDRAAKVNNLIPWLNRIAASCPFMPEHLKRVATLSVSLARRIEFPSQQLKALEYAATLHDIGKITIDADMINKPVRLTHAEDAIMRQHPIWGHQLIQSLLLDPLIAEVILYHHENYDGSGYPAGLKGKQIPLAARIVRLTDSYDAMTNARPYHSPHNSTRAIKLLQAEDHYFDPMLLQEFIAMLSTSHSQCESVGANIALMCAF